MTLTFMEPKTSIEVPRVTNWDAIGAALAAKRGKWALVKIEDHAHAADPNAAILQCASWLRTKKFKTVAGFEAQVAFTDFGVRGVFARIK